MRPPWPGAAAGAPRGYSMLAALLVVAVLAVIAVAALQLGGSARQGSGGERDHQQALALAELGLERTRAYLAQVSATDVDLDRALDPNLDTVCVPGPPLTFGAGTAEDHFPPFTGAGVGPVAAGPAGRMFMRVPSGGGAYLVRIDDNEDDENGTYLNATGNHQATGCAEGAALGGARQNPVRDRDRTVVVTVIGIYPGTTLATARATRTLRVELGPGKAAGIYAGGDVDM
ncbi:MAG TPA: PilX N-terminal domain-containing pilus assembly protein, partial [Myxococcales bacterium]|nr:PilX N-terminal domain-containing pilus assembly protein [Myxococcales bacterium]